MIYIKTKLSEDVTIKVDLYGDEFYCTCPKCGEEQQLDEEMIKAVADDFAGTNICCAECSRKIKEEEKLNNENRNME